MKKLNQLISQNQSFQTTKPQHAKSSIAPITDRTSKILKVFPTHVAFLEKFNFDECLTRFSDFNTPELALKSGKIKLNELAQAYSRQTPISMLELWLLGMSNYMGWEVSGGQIKETAIYLYEDNHFWNLAEATLFFKNLKKGRYGTFYGKFDGMKICTAAKEFRMERGRILSRMPDEEHKARQS